VPVFKRFAEKLVNLAKRLKLWWLIIN